MSHGLAHGFDIDKACDGREKADHHHVKDNAPAQIFFCNARPGNAKGLGALGYTIV